MNGIYWLGSEDAWQVVLHAQTQVADMIKQGRTPAEDRNGMPLLWEKHGDTALVHIRGSLVDGSAGWMRYFGVTGYDDLSQAALQAVADPDVKKMLFLVDSGGGMVAGMADYGRLLEQVSSIKPSAVHTATKIGSAAYWSAASVKGRITLDPTAEVGSIGAVVVHADRSKMFEAAGIKHTVIRSGNLKMAGNPYEPLSEEAEAHVQSQIDDLRDMFVAHIKQRRPGMTASNLTTVQAGQTFMGKRAVAIGLADSTASFGQALKLLDKNSGKKDTPSNSKGAAMSKFNLTEEQVTRLQAGATLAELGIEASDDVKPGLTDAEKTKLAADEAATKKAADDAAAAKLAADTAAAAAAGNEVVKHLQVQLDTKTSDLAKAQADLASAKAATTAAQATHDGLLAIARTATEHKMVALGASAGAAAALDAPAVIAKFAEVDKQFNDTFRPGGIAKPAQSEQKQAAAVPEAFRTLEQRNKSK